MCIRFVPLLLLLGSVCAPVLRAAEESVPPGFDFVVSPQRGAPYPTLQAAVDAAPEHSTRAIRIFVKAGEYRWQQTLIPSSKPFIHVVGEDRDTTIISHHLNVYETLKERHLKGREGITVIVQGDNFRAENLTFANTSGDRGQALALRLEGDRNVVLNCRLLGWQDTLRVDRGRHYFRDCYIEGRVDFIYSGGTAVFEDCVLHSKAGGYLTAASTPEDVAFGYVFLHCQLTGDDTPWEGEVKPRQAYLGRPWRDYAAVAFIECEMGAHIKPEGWHNWGRPEKEKTARYTEYRSTGPGANPEARVKWSRQLTDAEAATYTLEHILGGEDHWNPLESHS